ncbi:hypothetical protein [Mycobacterium sp.]|uniref:hypothetical protein n=1 Tax=Mycobacterium sp. TaxID=1785 RepID=UPI003F9BE2C0
MAGEGEHEHAQPDGLHVLRRGTHLDAADLMRNIIATRGDRARTAHDIAADTTHRDQVPDRVCRLIDRHTHAVQARQTPTDTGLTRPRIRPPNGSAGLTSTSTAAKTRASITASTSNLIGAEGLAFPVRTRCAA